ncbi:MAG TPA: ATP-binding protein [Alkalispirochaeta sp.]|nr:ATP-binding protein [Alkalispirochaeta sp.]
MKERFIDQTTGRSESERLAKLSSYRILDTPQEQEFDDVAELAAHIGSAPVAYIGFLTATEQWFKARVGFSLDRVPLRQTYCQQILRSGEPLVIPDTQADGAFRLPAGIVDSEAASVESGAQVRMYVGVPILSEDSHVLGTLCVVDYEPRDTVPEVVVAMLQRLARQVSGQLELRRANRLLYDERDTFSVLFEAAPAPLVLVKEGRIVRANYAFAVMVTHEETTGLEDREVSSFFEELPASSDEGFRTDVRDELGGTRPVLAYVTRLRSGEGVYDLVAVNDISDRIEKERVLTEQRQKAENANRIKDTFLSLVSHDLRSPLSGIFTMLDLLSKASDSFSPEELQETINEMRTSASVLVEMINQLLNIHRLQSGHVELDLEPVSLKRVCEQVTLTLRSQFAEKQVHLDFDIAEDASIVADAGLLREAVFNLVSNAAKFSEPHGHVRVWSRGTRIAVEDDGNGVPEEDRADLFRHEVKTSRPGSAGERGTGLGLPLVADIMEAHGGRVFLDEEYRHGARFVLELPEFPPPQ